MVRGEGGLVVDGDVVVVRPPVPVLKRTSMKNSSYGLCNVASSHKMSPYE